MAEMDKISESQQITTDARGNWQYPSAAAEGYVEVECPMPHGTYPVRRLHAREFPATVVRYVEESLKPNPYPKSMPMKSPPATVSHFVGAARGLQLLDEGSLKHMETLAKEFAGERDQQAHWEKKLKPFILSLASKRR